MGWASGPSLAWVLALRQAKDCFDSADRHPYTAAQVLIITRKTVSRETNSNLVKRHGTFARVLSFLLLGFIVYGTTVEAAHTHGRVSVSNSAVGVSKLSDPATDTKTGTTLLGCSDCLICQLHQGFSTSLISVAPSLLPSALKSRLFSATAVLVHSETTTPRRGRAPPFTL
jgi:hypothetical protein